MKIARILKKILIVLMLFVFLSVNFTCSFAKNEFYYSGTQKGTYQAKASFFAAITKMLADIADYLIGLATLGHRMFLVGWTSIAELVLNDTLEAAAGDAQPFELSAATLDMSDSNDQRKVTVENIVFNKIPLLDINFFNTEIDDTVTGTGAVKANLNKENPNGKIEATNHGNNVTSTGITLQEGEELPEGAVDPANADESVITIIKNAIAKWYYAMRSVAVGGMLLVLLYIALRLIVATVGEQKAKYKQMLYNWVVGFAVVFCIHYIMLFVIMINEELVGIFNQMSIEYVEKDYKSAADKTNTEMELSLYSSLRSRAYELKASRGWIGTILYMVLVYYAIRFTLVYLKRYFTIMILAMMAPVMSATYAFGKVRTGKAESFNKWLKEFIFAVLLQSVHAMSYVTLITQLLKLTESSLAGVVLSFLILNFMLKTDGIIKRIFNMSTGQHGALDNILGAPGAVAGALMGLRGAKKVASMYGRYWLKPVYSGIGKAVGAGLSIPGSAILGATGGALAHYADNKAMNQAVARDAAGRNGSAMGTDGEQGMHRGPGGILLDENGNPIKNQKGKTPNTNRGSAWSGTSISGAFNPTHYADKAQNKINAMKAKAEANGKTFKEPKWKMRGAMMRDTLRNRAITSVEKTLYRKGYWDQPKMLAGIDAQIEKKLAMIKKERGKAYKDQFKQLTTLTGGMIMRTMAIPVMIANPKIGIAVFAKSHIMIQKSTKYDKKGKISAKSVRTKVEVIDEKTGEKKIVTKVKPVLFSTSAGTFVKKATGIAFFEGLSTNINDDIDKVMKQNKKDLKELEMLYDAREKLYELEILKQERIIEHEMFLADPQQALRRKEFKNDINAGELSVYNGRVMETNPLVKQFMEQNGITSPEQIVAMNALLKTALDTKQGDIRDMNIGKAGMYTQVMGNVHEQMAMMGLDKVDVTEEERIKMNQLGLTNQDIRDSRIDDVDAAMTTIKEILDNNPEQASALMKAIAIQEATADALSKKEDEITQVFESEGVFKVAEEQKEISKQLIAIHTMEAAKEVQESLFATTDANAAEISELERNITDAKNEIRRMQKEIDEKVEEKVIEAFEKLGYIDKENYENDKAEYTERKNILDEERKILESEKINLESLSGEELKQEKAALEERERELTQKEKALEETFAEFKDSEEMIRKAVNDTESVAMGAKTKIEIQDTTMVKTEEIMKSLVDNGGFDSILELERREKPTECQKIENIIMDLTEGGVMEVPMQTEDIEARAEVIKDLVQDIRKENLGETVIETYEEKYSDKGELIEPAKTETEEKSEYERKIEEKEKMYRFAEVLESVRKEENDRDPIEEIAREIEETIEKTVSKSSVANELFEKTEEGKDISKMSDELLREIYRDTTTENNETLEYKNPKKQDVVDDRELDVARRKIREKLNDQNVSQKDKDQLQTILLDFENYSEMSVEEFNRKVKQVNGVNAVAEEAFIKEMKDENSASNIPHNDDYVTTSSDRVRRSMNSDSVRESVKPQTEIQSKVAEILRTNDYATFEVVTAKSSGYSGKKYEKGPIVNISDIIKNLE